MELLVGVGFLGCCWNKNSLRSPLKNQMWWKVFYLREIVSLGLKVPFSLKQSWKMCSWRSSRARSKASVQSYHSMVELSQAQHPANFSPSDHRVWCPYGCGPCWRVQSMRAPQARSSEGEKEGNSFV